MAATVLRWEEPPPDLREGRRPRDVDHQTIAEELRRRPGRWAAIAAGSVQTGLVTQIRTGIVAAYRPAGSFEAVRRTVDGRATVYARYLGEPEGVSSS